MAEFDLTGVSLPFSLESEQSVLGAAIIDGDVMNDIAVKLKPEHFFIEVNKRLYSVLLKMFLSGDKIDVVTVLNEAGRQQVFENDEQAKKYIGGLMEIVPSTSRAEQYMQIVIDRYMMRSLILASKDIINEAAAGTQDADTLIDYAEQKIYDIRSSAEIKGLTHISGIVVEQLQVLNAVYQQTKNSGQPTIPGLRTAFLELDKQIFGLNRTDFIIVAARPGMGKTSFAMNIATNVAKRYQDKSVVVFTLEMSKEQIVNRMLSAEASLSSEEMKTGKFPDSKWKDIGRAADVLARLNIFIDDTPGVTVASIKAKLRRMKNLGLVIIDYLQLMSTGKNYSNNRVVEISEITRNLKIMAKELDVPVITLSQLARGPEQRPDKRPLMSDLRDSGSIEQDADTVIFLYRNSYYDKDDPNKNVSECIVAKSRHGDTGTIMLGWDGEYTRFSNIEYVRQEH